ncbi:P-loop NTPase fold protein [Prosthecobacter sp.]|uniref:P-loop NTPase fold protein n=1 Tax=Prosthecobacter sp. TaxID=1965333 RepID=UPI003784A309
MSKPPATTKPPRFEVVPPRMTILSDHPVDDVATDGADAALPDNLELASRLSAIFDILRHKETRCPLTVAVYGDWGTGKTSAMKWLEGKLNEWNLMNNERKDGHPNVHPVWFEPWKYHTREDVWRGIISEVILAMFSVKGFDHQHLVNGLKEAAKKFGSFLGRSFLHALSALKFSVGDEKEISGEVFRDIYDEWEKVSQPQKPYLNQFETTLADWVERFLPRRTETKGKVKTVSTDRIVLFIDDLDRCLPEVTLEVLEAIKLYLSIKPLIFVCGLDRTVVDAVVKKRYKDHGLEDGHKSEHYLNKIFQVEVDVAPSETQVQAFLNHTLSSMNSQTGQYLDHMLGGDDFAGLSEAKKARTARERLHGGLEHLARHNPREIKRLLNSALLRGRMAADNLRLHAAAKTVQESQELAAALGALRLPEREYGTQQPLLFAQGVTLYLLQRHFEGPYQQLGREVVSYLFRTDAFLMWLERLSNFLCRHADFQMPNRTSEGGKVQEEAKDARRNNLRALGDIEAVRVEYDEIVLQRPALERGQTIPVACFEHGIVFSLLRIPFSAQVARSAPSRIANSSTFSEASLHKLSPVLRDAVFNTLQKPRDEPLTPADLRRVETLWVPLGATDEDLAGIDILTQLTILDLSETQVGDTGMAYVSNLRQLTSLYLSGKQVGDAEMVHVSKLTQLTSLYLSGTQVGDLGMAHLGKLTKLTSLYLNGTQVGDAGMVHVDKLTQLKVLHLGGTLVSHAVRTALKARHPGMLIN